jgi:ubiquinone/menaquinone biosynthesis C-methylase UbiE
MNVSVQEKPLKHRLIKRLMKLRERWPDPDDLHLHEIFRQRKFVEASPEEQGRIMLAASLRGYEHEKANPFDDLFGRDLTPLLTGATVLDLGCATGGRAVAWAERYGLKKVVGIDVAAVYIAAARQFAESKGTPSEFVETVGESLPFEDASFDAILTYDVFEHVQDVRQVLLECRRVLRPKGKLILAFPSFYHPAEHHMSLVTLTPFIHYFFNGRDLMRVYNEIIDERGEENTYWYRRLKRDLEPWERLEIINGTSKRKFTRLVRETGWNIFHEQRPPLAVHLAQRKPLLAPLVKAANALGRLPVFDEALSARITFILEKP